MTLPDVRLTPINRILERKLLIRIIAKTELFSTVFKAAADTDMAVVFLKCTGWSRITCFFKNATKPLSLTVPSQNGYQLEIHVREIPLYLSRYSG